jgi:hypothetical protein
VPSIFIGTTDAGLFNLYGGVENGGATYRIRWEGVQTYTQGTSSSAINQIWEATFYASDSSKVSIDISSAWLGGGQSYIKNNDTQLYNLATEVAANKGFDVSYGYQAQIPAGYAKSSTQTNNTASNTLNIGSCAPGTVITTTTTTTAAPTTTTTTTTTTTPPPSTLSVTNQTLTNSPAPTGTTSAGAYLQLNYNNDGTLTKEINSFIDSGTPNSTTSTITGQWLSSVGTSNQPVDYSMYVTPINIAGIATAPNAGTWLPMNQSRSFRVQAGPTTDVAQAQWSVAFRRGTGATLSTVTVDLTANTVVIPPTTTTTTTTTTTAAPSGSLGFSGQPNPSQAAEYSILNYENFNIGPGDLRLIFTPQGVITVSSSAQLGLNGTVVDNNIPTAWFAGTVSGSYAIRLTNVTGSINARTNMSDLSGGYVNSSTYSTAWFSLNSSRDVAVYLRSNSTNTTYVSIAFTVEIALANTYTPVISKTIKLTLGAGLY